MMKMETASFSSQPSSPKSRLENPLLQRLQQQQQYKNDLTLIQDLLTALQDDDLTDITLVAANGAEIPACRFLLAARSPVLKRMLFGNFREANASCIPLTQFSEPIVRAIVEYCKTNIVSRELFVQQQRPNEASIRLLTCLAKAADYLELSGLQTKVENVVRQWISQNPLLACPVWDEADRGSCLYPYALRMIRGRPYVALLPPDMPTTTTTTHSHNDYQCVGGGIESLQADRILELFKDTELEAGELFLFTMLQRWVDHASEDAQNEAKQVARKCGKYFRLHYIEPDQLLSQVQSSKLLAPNLIVEAIMRQALKASQSRIWTINCRGKKGDANSVEDRVLVEGCGHAHVNGVYYRIKGLYKGDVYSKREVAYGQLYVYTLSCTQKDDMIESRIFCSKVLSHKAISSMMESSPNVEDEAVEANVSQSSLAPLLQPILLQVIHIELPDENVHNASPLAKLCKVRYCLYSAVQT